MNGALIPTRRYVNSNVIVLEEYNLSNAVIYNTTQPNPSTVKAVSLSKDVIFPPTYKNKDGKFDVMTTINLFENSLSSTSTAPFNVRKYSLDSIEINPSTLVTFATLNNRFGINWEAVTLSYLALVDQGKDAAFIRDSFSQYVMSMLVPFTGQVSAPSRPTGSCDIVSGRAPMAQFICGQLTAGPQWDQIIRGNIKCTQKGFAIADSLIRVAATRIFAIPEQSIMEPIVNSLDAYNPARKVGKFGMGFFSLMYWIMRDPKAKMRIASVYRRPGNTVSCAYGAEITNVNGELQVEVQEAKPGPSAGPNKFLVSVEFGRPIDAATLRKFVDQLNRLRYITSAQLDVVGTVVNSEALSALPYGVLPRVGVALTNDGFSVTDEASGVPIEVFYSSLIVPSISSKTISLSTRKDTGFIAKSRVENKPPRQPDSNYSSFRVLVGDIVIMDLKPEELFTAHTSHILTLPLNTRVPVSRDDVILSSVLPEVEENLLQLFRSSVGRMGDSRDIGMLENGLKAFINETASSQNIAIINRFLALIPGLLRQGRYVAVPATSLYLSFMRALTPGSQLYVTSNNVDIRLLEDYIATIHKIDDVSFTNRKVILVEGTDALKYSLADAGGTTSYLFVDGNWVRKNAKAWPAKLASEFKGVMLYPTGTPFATSLSDSIRTELMRFKSDRVRAAATAMAGQYQLALNFREPAGSVSTQTYLEENIPALLLFLKIFYEPLMSETRFEQFINLIASAVAKSEPTVAVYGSASTIKVIALRRSDMIKILGDGSQRDQIANLSESQYLLAPLLVSLAENVDTDVLVRDLVGKYSRDPNRPGFKDFTAPELTQMVSMNRELFEKASFYLIEIESYSIELASRFSILGAQNAVPFTGVSAFNIPLQLAFILQTRRLARGLQLHLFNISLSLLQESERAYQFLLADIVLYTLLAKLKQDGKITSQQAGASKLLLTVMETTKPVELARVILSAVDNEFGPNPQYRIGSAILYIYTVLGLGTTIKSDHQFKHLFHDLYKPALDVYGWMEKRVKVSSLVQEVDQGIPSAVPDCYSFTLSQMVSYVFQEELPPTVIQLFDRISRHQSRVESKLQIIEIATNEGTSKDPIPGKLTETVQNALDAIRTANYPNVTIPNAQIGILVKKVKGTNDLLLGISDPVGIPLNGLVALSVPFLSGKKPSDIVTGEIGSGFFNVYREAIGVFIVTTVDGETTEILDTPILDPNNQRIIDIQRCARVIRTGAPNGTIIFIQARYTDETFIPAAIEAVTFARDTIGLISEAKLVTLNKEPISIDLVKIYENQYFEFHMSTRAFSSYIMTKGVPFAPLYKYFTAMGFFKNFDWLLDKFRLGVRLNVKAGVFTPVQTRTRIGLSDENTNILIISMLKALPFTILFRMENKLIDEKEYDDFIQYFSSKVDAEQVLPGSDGTSSWANNMQKLTSNLFINEARRNDIMLELSRVAYPLMSAPLSENKISVHPSRAAAPSKKVVDILTTGLFGINLATADTIAASVVGSSEHDNVGNLDNLLQEGAKVWPDIGKINRLVAAKVKEMGYSIEFFPGRTIHALTYRWLLNKEKTKQRPQKIGPDGKPVKKEDDEPPKTTVKSPVHLPFCQVWVDAYCRVAQRIIPNFPKQLPVVVFDLTVLSNNLGSYNKGLDVLTLAYNYLETPAAGRWKYHLDEIIAVFSGASDPAAQVLQLDVTNSVWREYFMPKGTIAHELEHFRSGGEHAKGAHDAVNMNLPYGGKKKRVFLIQHHDLMMSLVQAGLYEEVRKAWITYKATGKI